MSITINLYYTGKGDAARKFAEEMEASGIAEAIRNEDGNERYEYYFPMNDPEHIKWQQHFGRRQNADRLFLL